MKRIFTGIILVLLLTGILALAFNIKPVRASGTIYIRADGSIDPPDAPISSVDNVTYTLTGDVTSDADGIVVERDSIVVDGGGYMVETTGSGNGITLSGRTNVTIQNTTVKAFYYGIYLYSSNNDTISGNNITNSVEGIYLYSSFDNNINENNITANNLLDIYYWGIHLYSSSSNSISGNNIVGNNITANNQYGIFLYRSSDSSINGNNITNNMEGIYVDYSFNVGITGNNITNNNYGMELYESINNTLSENMMNDNKFSFGVYGWGGDPNYYIHSIDVSNLVNGKPVYYLKSQKDLVINPTTYPQVGYLALIDSTNITVEGITLTNNSQGLLLAQTSNSTIMDNNIKSNDNGIRLDQSFNNTLFRNNITNNNYGIIGEYTNNTISQNKIADNSRIGIWGGVSNIFSENDIANNGWVTGMMGDWAGVVFYWSSGNTFCHNNFINNRIQVISEGSANVWDDGYPSGGNYWSDYNGIDLYGGSYQNETGSDGIGDTGYVIDGNNADHYPLMAPLSFFDAGTWNDTTYYMDIVSNSTVSHFHFDPDEGALVSFWVKRTLNETFDFCRVTIPKDLLWVEDGWTVLYGSYPLSYKTFSDENYTYLYFTYTNPSSLGFTSFTTVTINATHVIPEFPSFLILPLFMIATFLAVIVYKKKGMKTSQS